MTDSGANHPPKSSVSHPAAQGDLGGQSSDDVVTPYMGEDAAEAHQLRAALADAVKKAQRAAAPLDPMNDAASANVLAALRRIEAEVQSLGARIARLESALSGK